MAEFCEPKSIEELLEIPKGEIVLLEINHAMENKELNGYRKQTLEVFSVYNGYFENSDSNWRRLIKPIYHYREHRTEGYFEFLIQ